MARPRAVQAAHHGITTPSRGWILLAALVICAAVTAYFLFPPSSSSETLETARIYSLGVKLFESDINRSADLFAKVFSCMAKADACR